MTLRSWRQWVCVALITGALTGCASSAADTPTEPVKDQVASQAPKSADGILFVSDGQLMVIQAGKAEAVSLPGPVQAIGTGADVGGMVLRDSPGQASAQVSWFRPGSDKPTALWTAKDAGSLGTVRYLRGADAAWFSTFGDPKTQLKVATPPSGEAMIRALDSSFNGEFDVDERGEIVAYVGNAQNPSVLMVADAEGESAVPTKLDLIFSPDLSADGATLCFVGGQSASDLSLWIFDREQGVLRELTQTRGLKPTVPVLSTDGARVAFRSADDGAIWIADLAGGKPQKLPFVADEGPLGW